MGIIIFLLMFVTAKKKISPYGMLLVLVVLSISSSIFLGYYSFPVTLESLFIEIFLVLMLAMIVSSTKTFKFKSVVVSHKQRLNYLYWIIVIFGLISLLLNLIVVYYSYSYVAAFELNITQYKNEGEAADYIRSVIPSYIVSAANFLSPLGYAALVFHFYYLSSYRISRAIVLLLITMNIPLVGFHGLSRAAAVQYILVYIFLFLALKSAIPKQVKMKLLPAALIGFASIFIMLLIITFSRFSDGDSANIILDNGMSISPVLFWSLDYFGQWYANGIRIVEDFSLDKMWGGSGAFGLYRYIFQSDISLFDLRVSTIGLYASKFNGLVASLIYDFNYLGALFFIISISSVNHFLFSARRSAAVTISQLCWLVAFSPLVVLFFTNNAYSNLITSLGVFVLVLLAFSFKMKLKKT